MKKLSYKNEMFMKTGMYEAKNKVMLHIRIRNVYFVAYNRI